MIYNEIALNVVSKQSLVFSNLSQISNSSRHVADSQSVCPSWIRASTETHETTPLPSTPIQRIVRFSCLVDSSENLKHRNELGQ